MNMNRLKKIFQPMSALPKNAQIKNQDITSKSQRLMLELGIIKQASPGNFHLLPLGVRVLEKLTELVDTEMKSIDAQKLIFPTLTQSKLLEKTGRMKDTAIELFKLKDRHSTSYILSPTHEEAVADLLSSVSPISYRNFPLRLYQISSKYRDEMKPRFGLMRARQFLMKDLYTFDVNAQSAKETYKIVCESYDKIFKKIGISFIKVLGTTGNIGGSISHEYHYTADIGEDKILNCLNCSYAGNTEISGQNECPQCGEFKKLSITNGIEVGHTFLLGDKYSKPLNATYLAPNAKPVTLQMGCYGLGITRILAATVEVLSQEYEIRWPFVLAPYQVIIIPPKAGSKEELSTSNLSENIYHKIETIPTLKNNVLLDDRTHLTIGKRLLEAKRVGYPYVIAIGSKTLQNPPLYEINELSTNTTLYCTESDLLDYLSRKSIVQ